MLNYLILFHMSLKLSGGFFPLSFKQGISIDLASTILSSALSILLSIPFIDFFFVSDLILLNYKISVWFIPLLIMFLLYNVHSSADIPHLSTHYGYLSCDLLNMFITAAFNSLSDNSYSCILSWYVSIDSHFPWLWNIVFSFFLPFYMLDRVTNKLYTV